jgi:hypothetical protein
MKGGGFRTMKKTTITDSVFRKQVIKDLSNSENTYLVPVLLENGVKVPVKVLRRYFEPLFTKAEGGFDKDQLAVASYKLSGYRNLPEDFLDQLVCIWAERGWYETAIPLEAITGLPCIREAMRTPRSGTVGLLKYVASHPGFSYMALAVWVRTKRYKPYLRDLVAAFIAADKHVPEKFLNSWYKAHTDWQTQAAVAGYRYTGKPILDDILNRLTVRGFVVYCKRKFLSEFEWFALSEFLLQCLMDELDGEVVEVFFRRGDIPEGIITHLITDCVSMPTGSRRGRMMLKALILSKAPLTDAHVQAIVGWGSFLLNCMLLRRGDIRCISHPAIAALTADKYAAFWMTRGDLPEAIREQAISNSLLWAVFARRSDLTRDEIITLLASGSSGVRITEALSQYTDDLAFLSEVVDIDPAFYIPVVILIPGLPLHFLDKMLELWRSVTHRSKHIQFMFSTAYPIEVYKKYVKSEDVVTRIAAIVGWIKSGHTVPKTVLNGWFDEALSKDSELAESVGTIPSWYGVLDLMAERVDLALPRFKRLPMWLKVKYIDRHDCPETYYKAVYKDFRNIYDKETDHTTFTLAKAFMKTLLFKCFNGPRVFEPPREVYVSLRGGGVATLQVSKGAGVSRVWFSPRVRGSTTEAKVVSITGGKRTGVLLNHADEVYEVGKFVRCKFINYSQTVLGRQGVCFSLSETDAANQARYLL